MTKAIADEYLLLIINSGSSSIKYKLFSMPSSSVLMQGEVKGIGSEHSIHISCLKKLGQEELIVENTAINFSHHRAAFKAIIETLINFEAINELKIQAVGHRVVHGGELFIKPTVLDDDVLSELDKLTLLAPLHNPNNLLGIRLCREHLPDISHIAVFDTAFHQTMPEHVFRYAIPESWYQQHHVRRYGFHGCSHQYVTKQTARLLQRPTDKLNLISFHLGNGDSACAIKQGESVDISMGFTPLEGLIMGSRAGDLDASVAVYMQQECGLSADDVETMLNDESGLKALAGTNDVEELLSMEAAGDKAATLALAMFVYRIRKYLGAYLLVLGQVDAIVFTGGIGEHSSVLRQRCCADLTQFGIELDQRLNESVKTRDAIIDAGSEIKVLVIFSDEELQIAHEIQPFI